MKLSRIRPILKKEFVQAFRDKKMRIVIFAAPLIQLFIFGYAVNTDIKNLRTVIYDRSQTSISRSFADAFIASRYFSLVKYVYAPEDAQAMIDAGKAQVALFIPEDFSSSMRRQKPADVQIIIEGTDSIVAQNATAYTYLILQQFTERRLGTSGTRTARPRIEQKIRIWFNPDLKSRNFFIPGIIALLLTLVSLVLTSFSIVKEWEIGTMEQLVVTPLRPTELILGKTIPFFLLGLINLGIIFTVGTLWFGVPFKGSIVFLCIAAMLYLLNALGIGIFISSISRTQQQAIMSVLFFIMPSVLLSGFVFPIYNIPWAVRWISYINPMTYFLIIIRGVFLKGVGIEILWPQMVILAFMGIFLFFTSIQIFRERLD